MIRAALQHAVLRRLAVVPLLLLATSFLTHLLLEAAPGDYFDTLREDPTLSDAHLAALKARYGLDVGLMSRYGRWLYNAVHLDLGHSFRYGVPVATLVTERLGNTLILTCSAMVLAWGLAIPLGALAAAHRGRPLDRLLSLVAFVGLSIPRVFLALLAVMFAATTGWFPTGGMRDLVDWDMMSPAARALDVLHHLVLPASVVGLTQTARYMRQMRGETLDALGQDYVRTARAKGLSERAVLWRHALPNALNPLITLFGYSLGALLTGAFLVEVIFYWPGLARLTLDAVVAQDEPLVMASVLMGTMTLVVGNLVADLLLTALDPRVGRT